MLINSRDSPCTLGRLPSAWLFVCPIEVPQVGSRLILLGGHQRAIRTQKIELAANRDVIVALDARGSIPIRILFRAMSKRLVGSPGSRQGVIEYRDDIVEYVWVVLVDKKSFFEGGLIVEV